MESFLYHIGTVAARIVDIESWNGLTCGSHSRKYQSGWTDGTYY